MQIEFIVSLNILLLGLSQTIRTTQVLFNGQKYVILNNFPVFLTYIVNGNTSVYFLLWLLRLKTDNSSWLTEATWKQPPFCGQDHKPDGMEHANFLADVMNGR